MPAYRHKNRENEVRITVPDSPLDKRLAADPNWVSTDTEAAVSKAKGKQPKPQED